MITGLNFLTRGVKVYTSFFNNYLDLTQEAASHKMAVIWPLTSHHTNHPSKFI